MWAKLFFLITIMAIVYISIITLQKFKFTDDTLNNFIEQFQQSYIEDIKILPSYNEDGTLPECPEGYKELLTNYFWAGNYNGCGCKNENGTYIFYTNICPEEDCINVEEIQRRYLPIYNRMLLCYKRSDKNYKDLIFNLLPKEDYEKCENETHRICGFFDSLNNIICLPKNETCPMITAFIISDSQEYIENYKNNYDNDATISNIDSLYVLISHNPLNIENSNEYNNKILNNFRIDLSQPCIGGQDSPKSELLFDLVKNRYTLTCDMYKNGTEMKDKLYMVLNEENYLEFLKDNNFTELNSKIFEPFNISLKDKKIKLYAKSYPGWSMKCLYKSKNTFFNFLHSSEVLNKMSFMTIMNTFLVIILLICIGIGGFYFIEYFQKIFYTILLVFLIINIFYPLQLISNGRWMIKNLSDKNGDLCGDQSLNVILEEISTSCEYLVSYYTIIICITIVDIIVFTYIMRSLLKPTMKDIQERLIQLREFT